MTENTVFYSQNTWNLARGVASAALDVTEETVDTPGESTPLSDLYEPMVDVYTAYEAEYEVWPFEGPMDLLGLVDEHLGMDAESRELNDLAKAISTRIQEDPRYEYQPKSGTEPESEEPAGEPDDDSETPTESDSPDQDPVYAVAEQLYRCFVDHDPDTTFREIQSEFDSPFPRRSSVLTAVANTTGESKADRIENIAEWVDEWFDNSDRVQEQNRYAREPMGKSIRSD